jgi:hypothetical protein
MIKDYIGVIPYTHKFSISDPEAKFTDLRREARKKLIGILDDLNVSVLGDDEWTVESEDGRLVLVVTVRVELLPRETPLPKRFNAVANKDLIRQLAGYGVSDNGMARYFGCHRATITNLRHREGILSGRRVRGWAPVVGHW